MGLNPEDKEVAVTFNEEDGITIKKRGQKR